MVGVPLQSWRMSETDLRWSEIQGVWRHEANGMSDNPLSELGLEGRMTLAQHFPTADKYQ